MCSHLLKFTSGYTVVTLCANRNHLTMGMHSPHLCVGFLFWFCIPGASSRLLLPPPVTHHLSHTILSHTIFHIQLCHTPSFTHNFVNHHLSHTTLSHTIFHTQLCHTPSFTYNFVTHHLSHTTLSTTIFPIQLCHTPSFTPTFVTHHLSHTTLSQTIFHISHLPSFCVAGVAQTHICGTLRGKLTSTVVLRGRRGTNSHLPSFCVAGVAQTHIYYRFAWQAWHWWQWVGRLVWSHIHGRFAWQAPHSWHWVAPLDPV